MFTKEALFAILISVAVLFLTNFYLLFGVLVPKENMTYLGRERINTSDTYTYISFIEQGRQGRILFENLYDPEPQTPSLLRPSYMVLGMFSRVTHIPPIITYHLARVVFSIFFFIVLFQFLGLFFKTAKTRLFAYIFVLTSSGLGYLLGSVLPNITDRWVPESNTFLTLGQAPHFPLSQGLILITSLFLIKGWTTHSKVFYFLAMLSILFLSIEHPFSVPVIVLTLVLSVGYFVLSNKSLSIKFKINAFYGSVVVVLAALVGFLYQAYEIYKNPILKSWNQQNILPSPNILYFVLGYGFILPFTAVGLVKYVKQRGPNQIFIIAWIVASLILIYSPISFQRRFSEGFHIPLAILAVVGIIETGRYFARFIKERSAKSVVGSFAVLILLIVSIGSFGNIAGNISAVVKDNKSRYSYHILNQDYEAMVWIRENTNSDSVILANLYYGNILPGISGRKVYIGHGVQTPHMEQKIKMGNRFLQTKNASKAYAFLKENNISYIYFGKNDDMLQSGYLPDKQSYLTKAYAKAGVRVYRVR